MIRVFLFTGVHEAEGLYCYSRYRTNLMSQQPKKFNGISSGCRCWYQAGPFPLVHSPGPIPETVLDFWRMVWEENSRTIVMLTNTHERGKVGHTACWTGK